MRIAFVTPEYVTERNFDGGLANFLGRICPALVRMGHEAVVVVATDRAGDKVRDGVEIHQVVVNRSVSSWMNRLTRRRAPTATRWILQSWALNRACARLHRKRPFDLIQYASYTATGLFRLTGVPAVVRISSYESARQEAYDLKPTPDRRLMAHLDETAVRKADAVFGPSYVVAEKVERETGRTVEVIESPFLPPTERSDPRPYLDLLEGQKFLLFFGTLGVLKGVLTIAEVLDPLLGKQKDLRFVFIGKDGGYRGGPIINHVWKKAGPHRGRVLYLGPMPRTYLQPFVENASAVVLPSRIDNLPNTCLEAMAAGRLVIGTRGASFDQLIRDRENGFLINPDDPADLLETMNEALALPEKIRSRMEQEAARSIERLKGENALDRLVDYYRRIADAHPSH
jgi:glycosyltransferase involved in cell wall biosynthesis